MRKILIILMCLLITSCQNKSEVSNDKIKLYNEVVSKVKAYQKSDIVSADINVYFTNMGKYYTYDVIINNPKEKLYNVKALAFSSKLKDDYYPTSGILDNDIHHLIPGKVDKKNGYIKGLDLSGRVTDKCDIKVYISYCLSLKGKRVEKIVEIKNEN